MDEEWKSVPGYENYQASSLGRFRKQSRNGWVPLGGKTDRLGYQQIGLTKNGKQVWFLAHRLLAGVFLGQPELVPGQFLTVNHKNRIKNDNRIENLEFVTVADNHRHWRRHNLLQN